MKCLLIICVCAFVFVVVARADDDGCKDGETKKDDDHCNNCYCANGAWACTRKQCNGPKLTIKNKRDADVPCKDGDTKLDKDKCNQCACHGGNWACTEKLCIPNSKN